MRSDNALVSALYWNGDPPLRPLPDEVGRLLRTLRAPPRLAAHLRLVHDVAVQLADWVRRAHPEAVLDREAVLFGAATHDVGKVLHPGELTGPGSAHEEAGRALLAARGYEPRLARFAGTHAAWTAPGTALEDLLVSLADKIWKDRRVPELEDLVLRRLAAARGCAPWEVLPALDDELTRLGAGARERLEFQAAYPVHA
ncbi:HD domain-containing protein [Streptomyces sp. NPDC051940]|uniref:HD domain-containing protein n=1 Tax=Streptomyces sp. NPDC051940 TaxID=3155675 RepID=UPI00344676A6